MSIFIRKQPDSKEKTKSNRNGWYWKTLGIISATAVLLWFIAIVAAKCFDFYISEDSAVITVIGIIAGIVVIGNYAQVHEIKVCLDEKIEEVEKRQKETEKLLSETLQHINDLTQISNEIDNLAQNERTKISRTEP